MMQYYMKPERVGITYGTIDECNGKLDPPVEHIFLKEKAPWFTLPDDGLPRHDGFDAPFQKKLDAWVEAQTAK